MTPSEKMNPTSGNPIKEVKNSLMFLDMTEAISAIKTPRVATIKSRMLGFNTAAIKRQPIIR